MRRLFAMVLLLAACGLGSTQTAPANWIKQAYEPGNFTAMFPVAPKEESNTKKLESITAVSHLFLANANGLLCLVSVTDYSLDMNVDAEMAMDRDNFAKELSATVSDSHRTTFTRGPGDELPALEFVATGKLGTFKALIVMPDARRVYMIVAGGGQAGDRTADIDYFFKSFKLTKKP